MDMPTVKGAINGLALCAGGGALELGLHVAVPGYRTVCFVEWESRAAATLVARMADTPLGEAPVWDDLGTFDGGRWRGVVDIVTAGFPCQPFSVAGNQRGVEDERHLWPDVARVVGECGAEWVFCENVPGLLTTVAPDGRLAIDIVTGDLEALGYAVEVGIFSAEEVGAPHLRERVFILAHADREGSASVGQPAVRANAERSGSGLGDPDSARRASSGTGRRLYTGPQPPERSDELGDASGAADQGRLLGRGADAAGREEPHGQPRQPGDLLADTDTGRWGQDDGPDAGGPAELTERGSGIGLFAPGRNDIDRWRAVLAVNPELAPATESNVRRVADGLADRVDRSRLAITGNGVVALAAAHAFLALHARLAMRGLAA